MEEKNNPVRKHRRAYKQDWGVIYRYPEGKAPLVYAPNQCLDRRQPNQIKMKTTLFGIKEIDWDPIIGSRYLDTKAEIIKENVYTNHPQYNDKVLLETRYKVKLRPSLGDMTIIYERDLTKNKKHDAWRKAYRAAAGMLDKSFIAIESNRDLVIASSVLEHSTIETMK